MTWNTDPTLAPGVGLSFTTKTAKLYNRSDATLEPGDLVVLGIGAVGADIVEAGANDTGTFGAATGFFSTAHNPATTANRNDWAPYAVYIGEEDLADNDLGLFLIHGATTKAFVHSTAGTGDVLAGVPLWWNSGGEANALELDAVVLANASVRYIGVCLENGSTDVALPVTGDLIYFNGFGIGWTSLAVS